MAIASPRLFAAAQRVDGRPATVELRLRLDTVEVSLDDGPCAASIDRDELRAWMAAPGDPFVVDEVTWSTTASAARVFLTVGEALWSWPVPDCLRNDLRSQL